MTVFGINQRLHNATSNPLFVFDSMWHILYSTKIWNSTKMTGFQDIRLSTTCRLNKVIDEGNKGTLNMKNRTALMASIPLHTCCLSFAYMLFIV